jgi:hypothetical protein
VGANCALLIEHVRPGPDIFVEDGVQRIPHRVARNLRRRAAHVALNVWCKGDSGHLL